MFRVCGTLITMSIESREPSPLAQVESHNLSPQNWGELKEDVLRIEKECFGESSLTEEDFMDVVASSQAVLALLKKGHHVIGFTFAGPDQYEEKTLTIYSTAITPSEQGKGHVASLMKVIEEEARQKGYSFISRYAATDNNYAGKIEKNYGERIVETFNRDSEWGKQQYFKIKL